MPVWTTEFFAVNIVTGGVDKYKGTYIEAPDLATAVAGARAMGWDYLQFTGESYRDLDHAQMTAEFYDRLTRDAIIEMNYNEFMDWLELIETEDELLTTRKYLSRFDEFEEHIKVINVKLKEYAKENNEEKEEGDEEDPSFELDT